MSKNIAPFPPFKWGWLSFDLGAYRPCDGTYCFYAYDSLPPLPIAPGRLNGSFRWLATPDDATNTRMAVYRPSAEARSKDAQRLGELQREANQLGLTFPAAFITLMQSQTLQDAIPSCTACYFQLADHILPCPGRSGGYLIRFLHDQQDVLAWDLYLTPEGQHCVTVSPFDMETLEDDIKRYPNTTLEQALDNNAFVCASTFEEFIYRFWLENTIWFNLNESSGPVLTPEQQQYLAHYSAGSAS